MDIRKNTVTAVIGPSGCGKSTFIRCLNRMSDAVPGIKVEGRIDYHGHDLHGPQRSTRSRCGGGSGWSSSGRTRSRSRSTTTSPSRSACSG
mgnify:CR=1 FL=1